MAVVNFNKVVEEREPLIWLCNCSNGSFVIYQNGSVQCAECDKWHDDVIEHKAVVKRWTRKGNNDVNG